jgi:hypothetical protein
MHLSSNFSGDPVTQYHWLEFENRRLKISGNEFQRLFEDIMVRAKPGFIRIRPYGSLGDRKCDGLFQADSTIYQVYSPDELKQADLQKKINEDLDGAVQHWKDGIKKWIFVYNDKKGGLPPDIPSILEKKKQQYPNITIEHLSNDGLWELTRDLTVQQRTEIFGAPASSVPKNINLNNVIISNKFCESVNSLGRFLNYFLADELGHEVATELINNSFYTVVEQDQQAFIDSIVSVFTRKNLDELSNLVSASEKRLSWKEYFIFALQKISDGFENLLMRYSGSADQTLIYELQELKNFTETVIDSFYSNNSQYMKETYPDEVRSKTYAESILKPYLLQLIRVRILVLSYSSSP